MPLSSNQPVVQNRPSPIVLDHPRTLGWFGTACIAMGGSNQSLFIMGALFGGQGDISGQGSAAVPLLIIGFIISLAATPGWIELTLMYPNRVGGIAATCAEAFKPYSQVLSNLTGVCYWWGWIPTCGITAIFSASAIQQWYLPNVNVSCLATFFVLLFTWINIRGIHFTSLVTIPIACVSATLAFLSALIPVYSGTVNWQEASTFHLNTPFPGWFGDITSMMAGLYLIGFAAPAFEQAACHVGEQKDPNKNHPYSIYASAFMASIYFIVLPIVWLGVLGPKELSKDLVNVLGPTYAPLFGATAKSIAVWFIAFNLFHGTIAPLAGSTRTLLQLADDGLLPKIFSQRAPSDAPLFATFFTAMVAIAFLWLGDPIWLIAAANFTYLIGICLPNVAVWLLRKDQPEAKRPWRAPKGTINLGLFAASMWAIATIFGFEQFGLPTVIIGVLFAYSGSILFAIRKMNDRREQGLPYFKNSIHIKLTGAMMFVLFLDALGYLIAVSHVPKVENELITILADIFVVVAILTISVGLILPGIIARSATDLSEAAKKLTNRTMLDLTKAMEALGAGRLDEAVADVEVNEIVVHTRDEIYEMAISFNALQNQISRAAKALDSARQGLIEARKKLLDTNLSLAENEKQLKEINETLEERVKERTHKIELIQRELQDIARKAGMGEVATNVIHNIGNVLNSINTTAHVVMDKIQYSKLNDLEKINQLLIESKSLLHEDENKNKLLNEYLKRLSNIWTNEQIDVIKELKYLNNQILHIQDIISAQQNSVYQSNFEQEYSLNEVLDEVFRITNIKNQNIKVEIIKDSAAQDTILIDKNKLQLILINLINNAKDSVLASDKPTKTITLMLKFYDSQFEISIKDNGVGIPPMDLKSIFSHGYTTKKTGHGFGLHSCALAASALKGKLIGTSEGVNQGATFTLSLPYKKTTH